MHGLLGRAALAVDRGRRNMDRVAGGQPGHSAGGGRLLAGLRDAADEHVVDLAGVDPGPLDQGGQCLRQQVDRMDFGQRSTWTAAAGGGAQRVNNQGISSHGVFLLPIAYHDCHDGGNGCRRIGRAWVEIESPTESVARGRRARMRWRTAGCGKYEFARGLLFFNMNSYNQISDGRLRPRARRT